MSGRDDLLEGKRPRRSRRRRTGREPLRREFARDGLLTAYEDSPWPATHVPSFPPGMVELYQHLTGRAFDPDAMATFVRIQGFLGYAGVVVTPQLAGHQRLSDPNPDRAEMPPVEPSAPERRRMARPRITGMPDPDLLGED